MTLKIVSDHQGPAALLREIAQLCHAHGAHWHPELIVEVEGGAMRLLAPPGTTGPLITIPTDLLVPIEGARWAESSEQLNLLEAPPGGTPLRLELLQLHAALYNATGKLHWWRADHPARLVETCPDVAAALAPLKPRFGNANLEIKQPEGFLATRSFGWQSDPAQENRQQVLMPLIDLLNHHHAGAAYRIRDGAMRVKTAQAGGNECFAHYGNRRDVLDLALHYGHLDQSTPFAHSAPLDIAVEGIGRIRVEHQGQRAPVHPLDPPRVTLEQDGLLLSHLCCHQEHPERVQTLLKLALQGSLKRHGHDGAGALLLAQCGLEELGAANLNLLNQLQAVLQASEHAGAATLAAATQRQAEIIKVVMGAS
jgi:hypothetical protein